MLKSKVSFQPTGGKLLAVYAIIHPLPVKTAEFRPIFYKQEESAAFKNELPQICLEKLLELNEARKRVQGAREKIGLALEFYRELRKLHLHRAVGQFTLIHEENNIRKWAKYWRNLNPRCVTPIKKGQFTEAEIERAKNYPLQDLVGEFRTAGSGKLKAKCPFHEEKSPSFIIYTNNNDGHCFGCQVHISGPIDYLMKLGELSFKEAVRRLI